MNHVPLVLIVEIVLLALAVGVGVYLLSGDVGGSDDLD